MEIVYQNPWFKVEKHGKMHFVSENKNRNAAAILLLLNDEIFVFCKSYRIAINSECIEIPRGYGEENETSLQAAIREAREETGFDILFENIQKIGEVNPNSGILASTVDLYFAKVNVDNIQQEIQIDEEIDSLIFLTKEELKNKIINGEIKDSFSLASLAIYFSMA